MFWHFNNSQIIQPKPKKIIWMFRERPRVPSGGSCPITNHSFKNSSSGPDGTHPACSNTFTNPLSIISLSTRGKFSPLKLPPFDRAKQYQYLHSNHTSTQHSRIPINLEYSANKCKNYCTIDRVSLLQTYINTENNFKNVTHFG